MSKLTRDVLVKLSQEKADAAWTLLGNGHHTDAYYLSGYAVELALKAILAKEFVAEALPDKNRVIEIYTHNLENLIKFAGLRTELDATIKADQLFKTHWDVVKIWDEKSRYSEHSPEEAYALVNSIVGEDGILSWIMSFI